MPLILALGRWKQENQKFKVIPNYTEFKACLGFMRPCLGGAGGEGGLARWLKGK